MSYSYYQTKAFLTGPVLEITEPLNGSLLTDNPITIRGYTKNISYISINDRQIFVNETGNLDIEMLLSPGYNIIKVSAKDKYEREIQKQLELVFNQKTLKH